MGVFHKRKTACGKGERMKNKQNELKKSAVLSLLGLTAGVTMCMSTVACGDGKLSESTQNLTKQYKPSSGNVTVDTENKEQQQNTVSTEELFETNYTDFTFEMLGKCYKSGENCMISPLSIMTALTMTENGAATETLEEMEQVLANGTPVEMQNEVLTRYCAQLTSSEKAKLNQANSIWIKNSDAAFHVNDEFVQKNVDTFDADIYAAPFDNDTLKDINTWINKKTDGMIPNMLNKIEPDTVMFLINAIAFDAEWETVYEEYQIHDSEFYHEDGTSETVSMMYGEESVYLEDTDTIGFMKPYKEGYQFVALLPKEEGNISEYVASFNGEKWCGLIDGAEKNVSVDTGIPEFKSEYTRDLCDDLIELGMPLAFDAENADLSGIGAYDGGNLFISMVLHKTYVEVNAKGTKAAAATIVGIEECTAVMEEERKSVILNRPFVYVIVDNESNLPIFIGVTETVN